MFTHLSIKRRYSEADKMDVELTATAFERLKDDKAKKKPDNKSDKVGREGQVAMLSITPERLRAVRRWLLQSAFGLLVFGVALYFCFPYDRAKDLAIAWAGTQGYDVTIGSAGPGFGFAVNFKDIRVRSRPTGTGKPVRFSLDSARVRVSPFVMFSKATTSLGLAATGLGGELDLDLFNQKKGPMHIGIKAQSIDLSELPGVRETINLPITGTFEMSLDAGVEDRTLRRRRRHAVVQVQELRARRRQDAAQGRGQPAAGGRAHAAQGAPRRSGRARRRSKRASPSCRGSRRSRPTATWRWRARSSCTIRCRRRRWRCTCAFA